MWRCQDTGHKQRKVRHFLTWTFETVQFPRLQRALKEFNKQVDSACGQRGAELRLTLSTTHLPPVDRALGEISRSLVTSEDQLCFCQLGGVASVLKMLMLSVENCTGSVEQWGVPHK